jgi:tRNA-splicing ligase RtcB
MIPKGTARVADAVWEIPRSYKAGMRVAARVYATEALMAAMDDGVFEQVTNVAMLPGIAGHACCMPDGHWGYGFPIGGVAAFDENHGVISPGGIGFDINCGMRLVRTGLTLEEVRPRLRELVDRLFERIPAGVGRHGFYQLAPDEFRALCEEGAPYCVQRGYGEPLDLELTEEQGRVRGADARAVSPEAVERGRLQVGTLGSGNHYLEIQVVRKDGVRDRDRAAAFGLDLPDQVVVMFHCGSRGFGHQVASDYVQAFVRGHGRSGHGRGEPAPPDRNLASAPFHSDEGQAYFSAMKCAVNMSFANRQLILHRVREAFSEVFHRDPRDLGIRQVYDVAHNIARLETHELEGRSRRLLVHRKGATRAFGPGMEGLPARYREVGQPVIIGGSMETGSWLLCGAPTAGDTFFTTAHGSGRTKSRAGSRKEASGKEVLARMEAHGLYVRTASVPGLAEEAGPAYKDIDAVVEATERAGLSIPVARLVPIGTIKG